MNKFRFVERKIVEKEINIKAKDELEAIDLFLKIKNQTDILDMDNPNGKSESYEISIDQDIKEDNKEELEEECDEELDEEFYEEED